MFLSVAAAQVHQGPYVNRRRLTSLLAVLPGRHFSAPPPVLFQAA